MSKITVKLFAGFREGRFHRRELELAAPAKVSGLLRELEIPIAEVGVLLVNGRHVEPDYCLKESDTCSIFPKVGGG